MELRHLRYFQAVAETLNFSRAAERLRIAQPSLSRQIRDLERELGVPLFQRTSVRVQLTDAGAHFLQHVNKLFAQLAIATTSTQEIGRGTGGELNIGRDWRMPMNVIPQTVRKFRAEHPRVAVNLIDLPMHEHLTALRAGSIHLGFIPKNYLGARDDLDLMHVSTSEIRAVLPATHPLAERDFIRLRDLKGETFLLLDEKHAPGFRTIVTQSCRLAQFTPKFGRTASRLEEMFALVETGDGVCLMPASLIGSRHENLRFPSTDEAPFELFAVWLKTGASPLVKPFLDILREHLSGPSTKSRRPHRNVS